MVLSLGNLHRRPRLPNRKDVPARLQTEEDDLSVLRYLPYNNPANVTILLEASGLEETGDIAEKYGCCALIAGHFSEATNERSGAHPIACIVPGNKTTAIELLRTDEVKTQTKQKNFWLTHSATFRVI